MPVASKLIQKKVLAKRKKIHNKQIRAVKSVIDTKPPMSFYTRQVNAKKIKMREDRMEQIEKANSHLVEKMMEIMHSNGTIDTTVSHEVPVSLNLRTRVEERKKIERDNLVIMKRINAAKGSYSREFPEAHNPNRKLSPRLNDTDMNNNPHRPTQPSHSKPSRAASSPKSAYISRGGRKNLESLFSIGTKLGNLHVKMTVYDKMDGTVRITIYEPLSSKQYPIDLDEETVRGIMGDDGASLMTEKSMEAKKMWKNFADQLTLVPTEEDSSVFRLVVENYDEDDEYGNEPFEIVQGNFQFADPTFTPDPVSHDAAVAIQSKFRGGSSRKLVKELAEANEAASPQKKKKKRKGKKSPEKLAQEKAELEMLEVYEAQAVISKHIKGHLARKEVNKIKEEKKKEGEMEEGAIALQKIIRGRRASIDFQEMKETRQKVSTTDPYQNRIT